MRFLSLLSLSLARRLLADHPRVLTYRSQACITIPSQIRYPLITRAVAWGTRRAGSAPWLWRRSIGSRRVVGCELGGARLGLPLAAQLGRSCGRASVVKVERGSSERRVSQSSARASLADLRAAVYNIRMHFHSPLPRPLPNLVYALHCHPSRYPSAHIHILPLILPLSDQVRYAARTADSVGSGATSVPRGQSEVQVL